MVQEPVRPSRDNLIAFLDFAGQKGLLKKATAGAYKKASNTILRILEETEAGDLSKVDLDNVIARHKNIAASKIAPPTLKAYETRTRAAVSGFLEYVKDPSSWKPKTQPRTVKTAAPGQPSRKAGVGTATGKAEKVREGEDTYTRPSVHIDLQIHISPEASPEQVDQVFASMRRHLYGNVGVTK